MYLLVTFDQYNASLLKKNNFFKIDPKYFNSSVRWFKTLHTKGNKQGKATQPLGQNHTINHLFFSHVINSVLSPTLS